MLNFKNNYTKFDGDKKIKKAKNPSKRRDKNYLGSVAITCFICSRAGLQAASCESCGS